MKIKYGEDEKNVGEIVRGVLIQQSFQPKVSSLKSISINFGTYCRNNQTSNIVIEIIRGNNFVTKIKERASNFIDNQFHTFEFNLELQPNLVYDLRIYSEDGSYGNAVTVKYGKPTTPFWIMINGVRTRGQLNCIFEYDCENEADNNLFENKILKRDNIDLSIIIPTAVCGGHFRRCIESIYYNTNLNFEVIVIVNSENSLFHVDIIKNMFEYNNFIVTCIPKMAGYVKTCNLGALISKGDYLCILNDDTIVSYNWANDIINEFKHDKKLAQIGPCIANCDKYFNHICDEDSDIKYVEGWCFIIPRKIYEKFGLFDEGLKFAYCEDSDYSYMLQKKGYRIKQAGNVRHVGVQTRKSNPELEMFLQDCETENKKYLKGKWKHD